MKKMEKINQEDKRKENVEIEIICNVLQSIYEEIEELEYRRKNNRKSKLFNNDMTEKNEKDIENLKYILNNQLIESLKQASLLNISKQTINECKVKGKERANKFKNVK